MDCGPSAVPDGIAGECLLEAPDGSAPGTGRGGYLADAPGRGPAAAWPARDAADDISTSQYPVPPSPHRLTGSLLMANRCPARSLKSPGISHTTLRVLSRQSAAAMTTNPAFTQRDAVCTGQAARSPNIYTVAVDGWSICCRADLSVLDVTLLI
jgi:hypothetical protein